ncbi:MAG TPA: hypothetical protein VFY75_01380 [Solirubrobacterales bacterium]|nr:hypothetical protein [Solirubrobacterales bacterium]
MASIAVFLVLGGASAFAAGQLAKNSVGKKQLKAGAVTTAKLKKNAVTTAKIKNNAVTGAKVKDGSLTGSDINLGTVGTVPSANSANSLAGQTTFAVRLAFGQSQVIASNGAVSFVANCKQEGGQDYAEVLYQTSANGAVAGGEDDWEGNSPTDFLNVDTLATDRELVSENETTGKTLVATEIDQGFVLGPEGKGLVANTEGIILGLNYGNVGCYIAGVVNAVG